MNGVLLGTDMVQKRFIERRLKELTDGFIVADAIFMRDPSNTPSIIYEENTNGLNADEKSGEVEARTESGSYPRIGMTADTKQALIKDYGLSTVVTYEAIQYNRISSISRSYIILGNSMIKYCDTLGLKALTDNYNAASTKLNTAAAGSAWSTGTADPFGDLMSAKAKVDAQGYVSNVAVVNHLDWVNALKNKDFRKEIDLNVPTERRIVQAGILAGQVAGLTIVKSYNMTQGTVWVGQDQVIGNRSETNNGVEIDTYKKDNSKKSDTIVDAFREVEYYLTDPKAGCNLSGV